MIVNKDSVSETPDDRSVKSMIDELHVQLNYVDSLDIPEDEKERRENAIMDNFIERHNLKTRFLLIDLSILLIKQLLLLGYSFLYSVIVYFILDYVIGLNLDLNMLLRMTIFTFGAVVSYRRIIKILQTFFERLHEEEIEEEEMTPQTKQDER